jgi:hypothetical protein
MNKVTPMTVFVSGSMYGNMMESKPKLRRALTALHNAYGSALTVIVGDCRGMDTMAQRHCWATGIKTIVHYSGRKPRNCINGMASQHVPTAPKLIGRDWHTAKDIYMTNHATHSIVVWNGHSTGSEANIYRGLYTEGHKVTVILKGVVHKSITSLADLTK